LNPLDTKSFESYLKSKNLFWCIKCRKAINLFFAFMHELPGLKNPFVKPSDGTPDGVAQGKMAGWNPKIPGNRGVKPDGSTGK